MKILNEKYLQQRIEELEKSEHLKSTWARDRDRDAIELQIALYKDILSNCEEVEVEEIKTGQRVVKVNGFPVDFHEYFEWQFKVTDDKIYEI